MRWLTLTLAFVSLAPAALAQPCPVSGAWRSNDGASTHFGGYDALVLEEDSLGVRGAERIVFVLDEEERVQTLHLLAGTRTASGLTLHAEPTTTALRTRPDAKPTRYAAWFVNDCRLVVDGERAPARTFYRLDS